jgi:hypothetical protein
MLVIWYQKFDPCLKNGALSSMTKNEPVNKMKEKNTGKPNNIVSSEE